jgi:hypothetical protein
MSNARIIDFFDDLTDFRSPYRNKQHELLDIVSISICAVVCGADLWEEIEEYGKVKEDCLKTFLALPNSIVISSKNINVDVNDNIISYLRKKDIEFNVLSYVFKLKIYCFSNRKSYLRMKILTLC